MASSSEITQYLHDLAAQITGVKSATAEVQAAIEPPKQNQPEALPTVPGASFYNGITVFNGKQYQNKYLIWGGLGFVLAVVLAVFIVKKVGK